MADIDAPLAWRMQQDGYLMQINQLRDENAKLRTFLGGGSIVTDYWKDEDGTMHVLTTDGEQTYEYQRGGLAEENAKLREMLAKARDPQRIGGTADPESFVYAIEQLREFRWQHATNDEDAIPYINNVVAAHERENAKLRETLKVLMMGTNAEMCADRDEADCTMCSMHHGEDGCTVVDAMELLGIDMYGMPLGVGVDG